MQFLISCSRTKIIGLVLLIVALNTAPAIAQTNSLIPLTDMEVGPSEQLILPDIVQRLRDSEVAGIGPKGPAFAGALFAEMTNGDLSGICLSARTSAPGGGRYGLFYSAVPNGQEATTSAWLYGLQQNSENRSNLAIVNSGETDSAPDIFDIELYDGNSGIRANTLRGVVVEARQWLQIGTILSQHAPGVTQGYVHVFRTSGSSPFIAYAVINNGGYPGERSGDGAFLEQAP